MDKTTYIVKAYGDTQSTHKSEAAAIKAASAYPTEAEACVVMEVRSGTYTSSTRVWPSVGVTHSN